MIVIYPFSQGLFKTGTFQVVMEFGDKDKSRLQGSIWGLNQGFKS